MPPKRKTVAELKQSGSYRPCRHKNREQTPSAPVGGVQSPAGAASSVLPPAVAEVRAELVRLLGSRLGPADGHALTEMAERVVEVRRLRDASRVATPGSLEYTRVSRALTTATAALDRLGDRFGMTPASRTSLPEPANTNGARTW